MEGCASSSPSEYFNTYDLNRTIGINLAVIYWEFGFSGFLLFGILAFGILAFGILVFLDFWFSGFWLSDFGIRDFGFRDFGFRDFVRGPRKWVRSIILPKMVEQTLIFVRFSSHFPGGGKFCETIFPGTKLCASLHAFDERF